MRTNSSLAVLSLVTITLIATGAQCPPNDTVQATLDEPFQLAIGQSAEIQGESLTVTFENVSADSRCPVDVTCPWAGDATVVMTARLQQDDMVVETVFELHTNSGFETSYRFHDYVISLEELAPEPVSTHPIDPDAYVATLLVSLAPITPHVDVDEPFDLSIGAGALVGPEELRVTFAEVPDDSRCPTGMACVWEGDAVVRLDLVLMVGDTAVSGTVDLHTFDEFGSQAEFQGYLIELLDLQPYPGYDEPIDPTEYVATLQFSLQP